MGGSKGGEPRTMVHIPAFADQEQVKVVCNGVPAIFLVDEKNFACRCPACIRRESRQGPRVTVFTPTEYERHAGMAASKKWKYSVRVDDDAANPDGQQLTIGRWLDEAGEPHRKTATGRVRPGGVPVSGIAGRTTSTVAAENQQPMSSRTRHSMDGRAGGGGAGGGTGGREALPPSSNNSRDAGHASAPPKPAASRLISSLGRSRSGRFAKSRSPSVSDLSGPERAVPIPIPDSKLRVKIKLSSKPPQGLEIPEELGSPPPSETKRWLLTQEQVAEQEALHVAVPPTPVQHKVSRVGPDFQARIPVLKEAPRVKFVGDAMLDDERIGTSGPVEEEALAFAAGEELEQAMSQPRDAIADVHMEAGWVDPRTVAPQEVVPGILDRSQRVRKRPGWLQGENLYGIRRRTKPAEEGPAEAEDEDEEEGNKGSTRRSRSARGRSGKGAGARGGNAEEEDDAEEEEEEEEEDEAQLQNWLLSDDRQVLSVAVVLDGVTYSGRLEAVRQLSVPRGARGGARKPRRVLSLQRLADSAGSADQDGYDMEDDDQDDRGYDGSRKGRRGADSSGAGPSKKMRPTPSEEQDPQPTSQRQKQAEERFRRMAEDGAPCGTACSLCHLEEDETVVYEHPEDGREVRMPLGSLLLVRTSTITHAWVHDECARWCPEVHEEECSEDEGEGMVRLEGLPEAVRRGRRIKCTECGQKGATLGCFARGCRRSFHLSCACVARCRMVEDTYAAFCPDHADQYNEDDDGDEAEEEEDYWEGQQQADSQSEGAADEVAANILGALHRNTTGGNGSFPGLDRNLKAKGLSGSENATGSNGSGAAAAAVKGRKPASSPPLPSFLTAAIASAGASPKGLPPAPVRSKKAAAALAASAAAHPKVVPDKNYRPGGGLVSVNSFGSSRPPASSVPPASRGSTGGAQKAAAAAALAFASAAASARSDKHGEMAEESDVVEVEDDDNDVYSDESYEIQPGPRGAAAPAPPSPPAGAASLIGSSFTQRITDAVRASAAAAASAPAFPQPSLNDMMKGAVHEVLKELREKAAALGAFNPAMGAAAAVPPGALPGVSAILGAGHSHTSMGPAYLAEALRAVQQHPSSASSAAAALMATQHGDHSAAAPMPPPH